MFQKLGVPSVGSKPFAPVGRSARFSVPSLLCGCLRAEVGLPVGTCPSLSVCFYMGLLSGGHSAWFQFVFFLEDFFHLELWIRCLCVRDVNLGLLVAILSRNFLNLNSDILIDSLILSPPPSSLSSSRSKRYPEFAS